MYRHYNKTKKFPSEKIQNPKFFVVSLIILLAILTLVLSNKRIKNTNSSTETELLPKSTQGTSSENQKMLPSQILNLDNWKITLPIGQSEKPLEIEQPKLASYYINPWFEITEDLKAIRFRAPVNGVTTNGSDYPRSELREMTNSNSKAGWSSGSGVHTMLLDQAITSVPQIKKDIVAGQIHDGSKDIIVVRLNFPNLHIRVDGKDVYTLDSNYELGKRFKIKFLVKNNKTEVYYNDSVAPVYTLEKSYGSSYFKAGAYTQSNCKKEGSACNSNNYGEVLIYSLSVTHQ